MAERQPGVRVAIVEDQTLLAEALGCALHDRHGMTVATVRGSTQVLEGALDAAAADVVVMAWRVLKEDGTAVARAARASLPSAPIVVMSSEPDEALLLEVMAAQCQALVSKSEGIDFLVRAIRSVVRGQTAFATAPRRRPRPNVRLTAREHDVLRCLGAGLSTHEIANELGVSWHTVRTHVRHVMGKFGTGSRVGAVAAARRMGFLASDPGD